MIHSIPKKILFAQRIRSVSSLPCSFAKGCFDMLKSIGFGNFFSDFFQVRDNLVGSTLVDLCQI